MPLEGQWERQHTPLRRITARERRVVAAALAALVAVAVAIALAAGPATHAAPVRGCVTVTAASTTGGATFRACGADAARWCRASAGREADAGDALAHACAREGYATAVPTPARGR